MYKSLAELNRTFAQHIDSLRLSGLEFDEAAVRREWAEAAKNFTQGKVDTPTEPVVE